MGLLGVENVTGGKGVENRFVGFKNASEVPKEGLRFDKGSVV